MLALTTAALIYGLTSWYLITKFRNYMNFVFLCAIVTNIYAIPVVMYYEHLSTLVMQMKSDVLSSIIGQFLFIYSMAVRHYWLIIICNMFYVDIVKVFDGHIRRRYLKSNIFGWGVSAVTTIITVICTYVQLVIYESTRYIFNVIIFLSSVPVILNCILYIVIVCSLFRNCTSSATNIWRRLYITTVIFILSDLFLLSLFIARYLRYLRATSHLLYFCTHMFLRYLNPLVLIVYIVGLKSNRELWYEFYVNKLNEWQLNCDIQMNVKSVRKTDDSRPTVIKITD